MRTQNTVPASYFLRLDGAEIDDIELNPLLGRQLSFEFSGRIFCVHCNRLTRKSFSQGYCYACFRRLAETDQCIMSPERCHFDAGTCRDPEWAQTHCMRKHIVYLANTSGLKVGITRDDQMPTRWIDQGAIQAVPIAFVARRQLAGLVEEKLREHISDRTQWQRMLKNDTSEVDLAGEWNTLKHNADAELQSLVQEHGTSAIELLDVKHITTVAYPNEQPPAKIKTHNFDKTPLLKDELIGIKGQYLLFSQVVVNIRKYSGYEVNFSDKPL